MQRMIEDKLSERMNETFGWTGRNYSNLKGVFFDEVTAKSIIGNKGNVDIKIDNGHNSTQYIHLKNCIIRGDVSIKSKNTLFLSNIDLFTTKINIIEGSAVKFENCYFGDTSINCYFENNSEVTTIENLKNLHSLFNDNIGIDMISLEYRGISLYALKDLDSDIPYVYWKNGRFYFILDKLLDELDKKWILNKSYKN